MEPYQKLITFQLSQQVYDLTVEFCAEFLYGREYLRTREQMIQAARSGKQNIAEGSLERSLKSYIKLLGVARASLGELLEDYRDFARTKSVLIWDKNDPRFKDYRYREFSHFPYKPHQPHTPELPLNLMINLICRATYLLDRQIAALEEKFVKEGGFTENLFRKRLEYRRKSGLLKITEC